MSDVQDDIRAAMTALEGKSESAPAPTPPASVPTGNEGVAPVTPPAAAPTRDSNGRFQPASPAAPEAAGAPAAPAATPVATPPAGTPPEAAGTPPPAPATPTPGGPTLDPSKPPSSWRPETAAKWNDIPEDIRQEIVRREEASARGVQQLQSKHAPALDFYRNVAAHDQYFKHINKAPADYFNEIVATEQLLTLGNPAQKLETLIGLGENYGIPIRQILDNALQGGLANILQQSHAHHKTPPTVPPQVQAELQRYRQAELAREEEAIKAEFDGWFGDGSQFPHFATVSEEMAKLMESGIAQTYQDAYDRAVWARPELRPSAAPPAADPVAQRQAAAAQISTPAPAPVVAAIKQPNEEESSVEDDIRKAWNAAARAGAV